jgi:hypothetical protein
VSHGRHRGPPDEHDEPGKCQGHQWLADDQRATHRDTNGEQDVEQGVVAGRSRAQTVDGTQSFRSR